MRILVGVYNPIAFDGRVQRACSALSALADVEVVAPAGPPLNEPSYTVHNISLSSYSLPYLGNHLEFGWKFVRYALRTRPDVIHAHDFFMAVPGIIASRLTGAKLVYDAHELIIPEPGVPMKRRRRAWYQMERFAVARADVIIAANRERAELMRDHYSLPSAPVVIRNIPPTPCSTSSSHAGVARESLARAPQERRFVYQGDVSLRRGVDRFIEAMYHLDDSYRLWLIGSGPDSDAIKTRISALGLDGRVIPMGRVPRSELHELLASCDVGLVSYPYEGLNNVYCAPNKVFEYTQAGLPVVASDQPPLRSMISEYTIGALISESMTPLEIAQVMRNVADNGPTYEDRIPHFLSDHLWDSEAERLRAVVAGLV